MEPKKSALFWLQKLNHILLFLSVCKCLCMYAHAFAGTCVMYVHISCIKYSSETLDLIFWDRVSCWTWSLVIGWTDWLYKPHGYSCLCLPSARITDTHYCSILFLLIQAIKLRSSCLQVKHFSDWTICPVPTHCFYMFLEALLNLSSYAFFDSSSLFHQCWELKKKKKTKQVRSWYALLSICPL